MNIPLALSAVAAASLMALPLAAAADHLTAYPNLDRYNIYDRDADVHLLWLGTNQFGFWQPAALGSGRYPEADTLRRLKDANIPKRLLAVVISSGSDLPKGADLDEPVAALWRRLLDAGFARVVFYTTHPNRHWE